MNIRSKGGQGFNVNIRSEVGQGFNVNIRSEVDQRISQLLFCLHSLENGVHISNNVKYSLSQEICTFLSGSTLRYQHIFWRKMHVTCAIQLCFMSTQMVRCSTSSDFTKI